MRSTTRDRRGDIVLVTFSFIDLSSSKRRPALVVSPNAFNDQMQDVVLVAITSQVIERNDVLTIHEQDCVDGSLPKTSLVKPAKLFTIHSALILKRLCALRTEKLDAVHAGVGCRGRPRETRFLIDNRHRGVGNTRPGLIHHDALDAGAVLRIGDGRRHPCQQGENRNPPADQALHRPPPYPHFTPSATAAPVTISRTPVRRNG